MCLPEDGNTPRLSLRTSFTLITASFGCTRAPASPVEEELPVDISGGGAVLFEMLALRMDCGDVGGTGVYAPVSFECDEDDVG
jgi:hypothetical protein